MTLGQKQRAVSLLVAKLIQHIYDSGYECTLGEALRTQAQADLNATKGIGIKNSAHLNKLAIDLNLFKDGVYLADSAAHKPFGDWWKQQGEFCCWGGDFKDAQDGNHYSFQDGGVK